ncbi:MAG: SpoIIE family protein phosphatase [Bacteroidales bacterium]|nr:SpoIIE family protein phosphatase [Bacteroidales bacterium]
MKLRLQHIIVTVLLSFCATYAAAIEQPSTLLDSLNNKLLRNYDNGAPAEDNLKILRSLYDMTKISTPYLALEYAGQALQIASSDGTPAQQAEWNEAVGDIYFEQKVYYMAMDNYFEAFSLYKKAEDEIRSAYAMLRYGDTYFIQNVEAIAMSNYKKADSLFIANTHDEGHAEALMRMGRVELELYQYDQAMEYFQKAHAIAHHVNSSKLQGLSYGYMAEIYDQEYEYDKEEASLNNAVTQYRMAGEKYEMAKIYFRLGEMHFKNEELNEAYTDFMRAYNMFSSFGTIKQVPAIDTRLGRIGYLQGDLATAEIQAKRALSVSDINQWLVEKAEALQLLSDINNKLGRVDSAYMYLCRFTSAEDSVYQAKSEESFSELQVTISTQEKEKELAIAEQTIQRKQNVNNMMIAFGVFVAIFMVYVFINFRRTKKMNSLLTQTNDAINQKNVEITKQRDQLESVTAELRQRNDDIEAVNESISSSIKYAARIQGAMLPNAEFIKTHFPDGFIYFHPRELVSGDVYWFSEVKSQRPPSLFRRKNAAEDDGSKLIMAVIDCTGHGVPGAFMSMLGDAFLNQIINLQHIVKPDEILNELHKLVRATLQQETTENNDGMDAAIIVVDKAAHTLQFSGAKNPLIYIQNGQAEKINGDLKSIGGIQKEEFHTFTCHEIDITTPTTIYMYSDGYQDQFGGEKGRKFMAKKFREFLAEIADNPFDKQNEILYKRFLEWRGNTIQMDDTTILGVKVS